MKKARNNLTISGRSLVELLAVIMIMGVIGMMVVGWLDQALDRNAAKQIYKDISMRAASLAAYAPLVNEEVSDTALNWPRGYTGDSEGMSYSYYKTADRVFAIQVDGMSVPACKYLREMTFKNSALIGTSESLLSPMSDTVDGMPKLICNTGAAPLFYFNIDTVAAGTGGKDTTDDECKANFYADADGECQPCPCGSQSPKGSEGIEACKPTPESGVSTLSPLTCVMGYQPDGEGCCSICPKDTYSPDGKECQSCPCNGKTLSRGSTSITNCIDPLVSDFTTSPFTCNFGAKLNTKGCCEKYTCPMLVVDSSSPPRMPITTNGINKKSIRL